MPVRAERSFVLEIRYAGSRSRMLVDFHQIQDAQAGDDAAFNCIVVAYRKRILATIARLIGRPEDVEDVAQEVFLRLYYSLDQLRTPEVFEPWLYRLTVNASYDYLRRQRRRNESRMADLSEQQVVMADAAAGGRASTEGERRNEVRELVDSLLSCVSEEDRVLLKLKEVEGLSLKELEKIYCVKENALKVRLFRARQRVLKAFERSEAGARLGKLAVRAEVEALERQPNAIGARSLGGIENTGKGAA